MSASQLKNGNSIFFCRFESLDNVVFVDVSLFVLSSLQSHIEDTESSLRFSPPLCFFVVLLMNTEYNKGNPKYNMEALIMLSVTESIERENN